MENSILIYQHPTSVSLNSKLNYYLIKFNQFSLPQIPLKQRYATLYVPGGNHISWVLYYSTTCVNFCHSASEVHLTEDPVPSIYVNPPKDLLLRFFLSHKGIQYILLRRRQIFKFSNFQIFTSYGAL